MRRLNRALKQAAGYVGTLCSPRTIYALDSVLNYLAVGQWIHSHGFQVPKRLHGSFEVFAEALAEIADQDVLYLEFGVFRGESMRFWSKSLRNPASELHGFDTFTGLPEKWSTLRPKGYFSVDGAVPDIGDSRIKFYKGLFEETLPTYVVPPHSRLFINVDCDLYSGARTVLKYLRPYITPQAYIYFDEFHHREHELKAFDEFLEETGARFDLVAADRTLSQVLFQCQP